MAIRFIPLLMLVLLAVPHAGTQPARSLDAYVIDVEGGEATLFVSPSGQSLLVDAGWPGFDGRDADRIAAVARQAGVAQIDYLVVTHFHADHMGGAEQLASRLPIRRFIDHGSTVDVGERARSAFQNYADVRAKGVHTEAKPGDTIPIAGLNVQIIAAGGSVIAKPVAGGGGRNPLCSSFKPQGPEITSRTADAEDSRSVSVFITYGRFRTVIMGDLTWNREFDLMCPNNQLGTVDAYFVSHHGSETSGSEVLVHALRPRVGIMNNGPRKGGAVQTFQNPPRLAGVRGLVAEPLLCPWRRATQPAAAVHREPRRGPSAGSWSADGPSGAHGCGALDQAVGPSRRRLHGDQQPDRLREAVHAEELREEMTLELVITKPRTPRNPYLW